jgi:hypothetical protein
VVTGVVTRAADRLPSSLTVPRDRIGARNEMPDESQVVIEQRTSLISIVPSFAHASLTSCCRNLLQLSYDR